MLQILRKCLTAALAAALLTGAAAAETTPPPLAFIDSATAAPTPAPTPSFTAEPSPAPTLYAPEVIASERQDDGIIRVHLLSLGAPESLHLLVAGEYALENDPGFRFSRGAEVTLFEKDGEVWLSAGGVAIDMGPSLTLTRHASDDAENGLYIAESEKNALYNGSLTVSAAGGGLSAVLHIGIEEYLYGVVAYEMSDSFPVEALKAQAVAARTYAMQRKYAAGTRGYDLVDTTADQVFKGFNPDYTNVIAAVDATRGVVGTYRDGFATCYYTASNGGQVAEVREAWSGGGDYGYIIRRDDPYDLENPYSLVNSVTVARDLSDNAVLRGMLEDALETQAGPDREILSVEAVEPAGAEEEGSRKYETLVFTLRILAPAPTPTPEAESRRFSLNLGSLFTRNEPETVEETVTVTLGVYDQIKDGLSLGLNGTDYELVSAVMGEETFTLEMRRFGHGVGMSQRGAQQMAGQHGCGWREILGFYYPGMTLEKMVWTAEAPTELDELPVIAGYARPEPTPRPTPAPLPAPEDGEWVGVVTLSDSSSTLNVRQRPGTGAMVLDRFENGRKVLVCSEPDENGWIMIRTAELTGYVMGSYITAAD